MIDVQDLERNLQQFIGTDDLYASTFKMLHYTDGVKYLLEQAQAYWLLDLIESHQTNPNVRKVPFQLWTLKKQNGHQAEVSMQEDSGEPQIVKQEIPYTDFPLEYFKLYCVLGDGKHVLMLPTEY